MTADIVSWLLEPIDMARPHHVDGLLSWHARVMVLAWGVIAPLAVIAARYFKIMPGQNWPEELDNKFWWHCHRKGQILALALTGLGLVLILMRGEGSPAGAHIHRQLGYCVIVLACGQALSAMFRGTAGGPTYPAPDGSWRGDHYDMTLRRRVFEVLHKSLGWVTILLAMAAVVLGLWAANAPRWMWGTIGGWWLCLAVASALLQIFRGVPNTYHAIWGPDPKHPGNRMDKPAGKRFRSGNGRL
jgi:uncharacterized membrane protein